MEMLVYGSRDSNRGVGSRELGGGGEPMYVGVKPRVVYSVVDSGESLRVRNGGYNNSWRQARRTGEIRSNTSVV